MATAGQLPQQYCLRWNNHQHNLLSVFEDLLNSEAFVDVTLACEGLQLKAHKMVLSACSPYFQAMLYNTPDRHPIVFLRDVRYEEMKALLEFMYRGEVSVDQENLSSLLKVAEGLKIKGLAEVNDNGPAPSTTHSKFPLLSPNPMDSLSSPTKRIPTPPNNPAPSLGCQSSQANNSGALGPKRKRARPRRFSGSEAVPMAGGFSHHRLDQPLEVQTEDMSEGVKADKGLREGNGEASPRDAKALDLMSEADSNDGRSSGMLTPKKELWPVLDQGSNHHTPGSTIDSSRNRSPHLATPSSRSSSSRRSPSPYLSPNNHEGGATPPGSDPSDRVERRDRHERGDRSGTKSFSEMSVRGLDLLRYATMSADGTYRCIECERVQITKNFKNKYSFQRHAFLYHEGAERKVFPCPICQKEFSRPDKMKSHLKTAHDCVIPKADPASSSGATANSAAATVAAAAAAGLSPSSLLVNPFLSLADPANNDGKLSGLKEATVREAMAVTPTSMAMLINPLLSMASPPVRSGTDLDEDEAPVSPPAPKSSRKRLSDTPTSSNRSR